MQPLRVTVWLAAMVLSGAAIATAVAAPLDFESARHLLTRTGFSASPAEISAFSSLTREQAADRLLDAAEASKRLTLPLDWVEETPTPPRIVREMTTEQRQAWNRMLVGRGLELRGWWLQEMLATPTPLAEKMTLFWHNHFVSSSQKVRQPQYLYRQNVLLHRHALGNFGEFLHAVARDPAMVIYLDSASNRKGQPNENFAREVMELFTLGEGHYTERDIKEAARAFTGYSINPNTGEWVFRSLIHDDGIKNVMGRSGNFDGRTVLDILLAQRQTAEHIVGKLWREFVSPAPDAAEVQRIAQVFRSSGYNIKVAMRALLTSDAFYAPAHRANLVKSPVELVVGTFRQFQFSLGDAQPFALSVAQLGQNLFAPPNVKGWPGGEAWINSTTLLARKQFLDRLFRTEERRPMMAAMPMQTGGAPLAQMRQRLQRAMAELYFDSANWAQQVGADPAQIERVVLAAAPLNAPSGDAGVLEAIRRLTQDPVYQLK